MSVAEAQAALGKMTRILKAFEGAQVVLDTLANAEQVGRELDAAIAAKRAELDEANRAVSLARETALTIRMDSEAKAADAKEKIADRLGKAEKKAEKIVAEAEELARIATDEAAAIAERVEITKAEAAVSTAEAEAAETRLAAAKAKLKEMMAD